MVTYIKECLLESQPWRFPPDVGELVECRRGLLFVVIAQPTPRVYYTTVVQYA